ncbi:hypothetical protein ACFQ0K_03420 [Nocardioides caeni]|uniref:Uncharacterized protein n=1 Tax=Nocardioides caeni TaxID=574700 RepID=A0A4V4HLF7_9ACTN|nr:hypothetical protein [Nocardioides caeni]THV18146.1 hypothetical protein E9934_00375 [Nocardioides caeni]
MDSVGGDGEQIWLTTSVSWDGWDAPPDSRLSVAPTLHCSSSKQAGSSRSATTVDAGHGGGGQLVDLLMPADESGEPLTECRAPAYIAIGSTHWQLGPIDLDYLNSELAKTPGRPYSWVDTDARFSSGYQVVVVPKMSTAEAKGILDLEGQADFAGDGEGVLVAQRGGAAVLFTWFDVVPEESMRALSRDGTVASYSTTVNGDDHVFVAINGKAVRSFDPFLDHDYLGTEPMAEEEGLDFEGDTRPASWHLLERVTSVPITPEWLLEDEHPAYLLPH